MFLKGKFGSARYHCPPPLTYVNFVSGVQDSLQLSTVKNPLYNNFWSTVLEKTLAWAHTSRPSKDKEIR